jgi:hypothetical protein
MPVFHGPIADPDDGSKRYKEPKVLRRMRKQLTYDRQLEAFKNVFKRSPASDDELDSFVEEYLREMYNSGREKI